MFAGKAVYLFLCFLLLFPTRPTLGGDLVRCAKSPHYTLSIRAETVAFIGFAVFYPCFLCPILCDFLYNEYHSHAFGFSVD